MTKAYSGRRLRIPVRLVDGKWEFLFGGQVPVKETAVAELVVDRGSISDEKFLEKMEWRETTRYWTKVRRFLSVSMQGRTVGRRTT